MKRITGKKGFTLAELLIVVAIIGVLVAISIPIFSAQLQKARLATNKANARAAYAAAMAWYIENTDLSDEYQIYKDGGMFDISTGIFTPGVVGKNPSENVIITKTAISEWTEKDPTNTSKLSEKVYKKWDVYWTESFDGTIGNNTAHN